MAVPKRYRSDVDKIVATRFDNGGDYWGTRDGLVGIGSPFSTVQGVLMLSDLGMKASDPIFRGASELILKGLREDGRFGNLHKGSIYPCDTATATRVLSRIGHAEDEKLRRTFRYLLESIHSDGGWRCNKFGLGRGPETESSNPGPTLDILDAFRSTRYSNKEKKLDQAVDFLLEHWTLRKPLGPCHFGIGTRFMQIEYPLFRYNLFNYVYVLSFYRRAQDTPHFREALEVLESKLVNGRIVVENSHRGLASLSFCNKGAPSDAATVHYHDIMRNLGRRPSKASREGGGPRG